ncbi:MAG TPA: PQQ-dependent sugar dehydrogenase [Solirubrobacteraceae bacterium]
MSVAGLCAAAVIAAPAHAQDFERITLAEGLDVPTAVAFAPDGRMFVAEKEGRVRVVSADGVLRTQPLLDITDRVSSFGDRGLLGLAVDAEYPAHSFLYLLYTREHEGGEEEPEGVKSSVLSRVPVGSDDVVGEETVIVSGIPSTLPMHSIGTVRSAPDGTLWAGTGDGGAGWNVGSAESYETYSPDSYRGKVFHVRRDGSPVPGHPYCPEADDDRICAKVFAMGFRNPFRFSLRPAGGLNVGDVGEITWEEINTVTGPGNHGWPCYEGMDRTQWHADTARCQEEYAKGPSAFAWPTHVYFNHTRPQGDAPGAAVVGGPTYQGTGYPAEYVGRVMYADTIRGWLRTVEPETDVMAPGMLTYPTDIVEGPASMDGDLVVVELAAGRVSRIRYAPDDRTPVAAASAAPRYGKDVTQIAFSSAGSGDPLGEEVTYAWDFGDGATSTAPDPTHAYAPGTYVARLTVTDPGGRSAKAQVAVAPGFDPPEVNVAAPAVGAAFDAGDRIGLSGSAVDDQGQPLTGKALVWDVRLHHADHEHWLGRFRGANSGFRTLRTHDADSWYAVTLTAADARGLATTSEALDLRPRTAQVRLLSEPPGAPLSYDGRGESAPWLITAARGFDAPISAAAEFGARGRAWWFHHWSNGGDQAQVVRVPPGGITLTAVYQDAGPIGPPEEAPAELPPPAGPPPFVPLLEPPPPDRTGPEVRLLKAGRRRLTGVAVDPAGLGGLRLALRRGGPRRCGFVLRAGRLSRPRRCGEPLWRSARLDRAAGATRHWTLDLGRGLPPGTYRALIRATDTQGNVAERWADGRRASPLRIARP